MREAQHHHPIARGGHAIEAAALARTAREPELKSVKPPHAPWLSALRLSQVAQPRGLPRAATCFLDCGRVTVFSERELANAEHCSRAAQPRKKAKRPRLVRYWQSRKPVD